MKELIVYDLDGTLVESKSSLDLEMSALLHDLLSKSIDVTKLGIDKAYGVRKLRDILGISLKEMIYLGDALFAGGSDYPAEETGVDSIEVHCPNETKLVTKGIIACLDGYQQSVNL